MSKQAILNTFTCWLLVVTLTGCNLPSKSFPETPTAIPTATSERPQPSPSATSSETQTPEPQVVTTMQLFLPIVEVAQQTPTTTAPTGLTPLAFLKQGDVYLTDFIQAEAKKITQSGDVFSFTWSSDGTELATFHGTKVCFFSTEGTPSRECLPVQLEGVQTQIERRILWSPDGKVIVLWNVVNPWDENAIGWIVLPLENPTTTAYIEDPIDWGAELAPDNEPGGITGTPLFIEEHTLIGTLTHRWLCGSGGCHYFLFEFDVEQRIFTPYPNKPEEGWSEGASLLSEGNKIINFGTFYQGCEAYITFMDIFDLITQSREMYTFEQEAISAILPLLDGKTYILARGAGCSAENVQTWDEACGLTQGFDVYALQIWDSLQGSRKDLYPGLFPVLSPHGEYLAFQSCLMQDSSGAWVPDENTRVSIYILSLADNIIVHAMEGTMPTWQPAPMP